MKTVLAQIARFPGNTSGEVGQRLLLVFHGGSRYHGGMIEYRFTPYFEKEVLRKRPYLKREWCVRVIENPDRVERQEQNRYRFWARIEEWGNRYLRVVTLDDKRTIHNAFPDRGFKP